MMIHDTPNPKSLIALGVVTAATAGVMLWSAATAEGATNPLPICKTKTSEVFVHYADDLNCDLRSWNILTEILPDNWTETEMTIYCNDAGGELEGYRLCFNRDF